MQRRLRLLDSTWGLVEIPCRKRCAGSGIAWVQVLRADAPLPAGFILWNSSRGHSTVLGLSMHGNSCAPCCLEYGARPLSQGCLGWTVRVRSPSSRLPSGGSLVYTMCQHHSHHGVICMYVCMYVYVYSEGVRAYTYLSLKDNLIIYEEN